MTTKFYNVGHGETISIGIQDNNDNKILIIRDFGRSRDTKDTNTTNSLEKLILNEFNDKVLSTYDRVDAILSHAHEDHFNGFKLLYDNGGEDIFDNGYIPYLNMNDINQLGGILIRYSLLMYITYPENSIVVKHTKHWLLAAPIMAQLSKKLYCIGLGDKMNDSSIKCNILWPCYPEEDYENKLKNNLLEQLEKYIISSDIMSDLFDKYCHNIFNELQKIYQRDRYISSETITPTLIVEKIEKFINEAKEKIASSKTTQIRNLYYNKYKASIDNHSIIFSISDGEEENLFLSDADDTTIKRMLILNKIKDKKYCFIKSSHHGTRGAIALNKFNIKAINVINCCGSSNSGYNGPDINYKKISTNIICTDWNNYSNKWLQKADYTIHNSKYICIKGCVECQ